MKRYSLILLAVLLLVAMLLPTSISEGLQNETPVEDDLSFDIDEVVEEVPEFDLVLSELTGGPDKGTEPEDTVVSEPTAAPTGSGEATLQSSGVPSALKLGLKEKYTLSVSGAKKYKSSNKKIATVSSKGVITAKKKGKATITVTTKKNKKVKVKVTVVAAPKKVKLNKKKATLEVGKTLKLKATLTKNTASQLKWKSSNKKVAKVSSKGKVTAVSAGKAKITVKTFNGKKATCTITVKEAAVAPTPEPTAEPTPVPTAEPTPEPTAEPTPVPTAEPTPEPTAEPTPVPTPEPTPTPGYSGEICGAIGEDVHVLSSVLDDPLLYYGHEDDHDIYFNAYMMLFAYDTTDEIYTIGLLNCANVGKYTLCDTYPGMYVSTAKSCAIDYGFTFYFEKNNNIYYKYGNYYLVFARSSDNSSIVKTVTLMYLSSNSVNDVVNAYNAFN